MLYNIQTFNWYFIYIKFQVYSSVFLTNNSKSWHSSFSVCTCQIFILIFLTSLIFNHNPNWFPFLGGGHFFSKTYNSHAFLFSEGSLCLLTTIILCLYMFIYTCRVFKVFLKLIAHFYLYGVDSISNLLSVKKTLQMYLPSVSSTPFSIFPFPLWIPSVFLLFILVLAILQEASSMVTSSVKVFLVTL